MFSFNKMITITGRLFIEQKEYYIRLVMTTTGVITYKSWIKILLVIGWLIASIVGFMVKLPSAFRHHDKELHAAFYFLAAGFLNVLFTNGKLVRHIIIFVVLYLFSVSIEFAQEYSNKFFRIRIHGRFDPEDVKYNLTGLIAFSALWVVYRLVVTVYKKLTYKEAAGQ
jgi:hypothetical protein